MRFTDGPQHVEKVLSRDESRPVLTMAHLDVTRPGEGIGSLEGTDSYKLVSVPVALDEGDESGFIPAPVLSAFIKAHRKSAANPPVLHCRADELELVDPWNQSAQRWDRPNPGTFPNVPRLIPDEGELSKFRVRFNAKLLHELAAGLGGDEVTLEFCRVPNTVEEGEGAGYFPGNLRPLIVRNGSPDHGIGLLIPMRLDR